MRYKSTRNTKLRVNASQAILEGISKDGGLFVPEYIPKIDFELEYLLEWRYTEVAYQIMKHFFGEFEEVNFRACINKAYDDKFRADETAPVVTNQGGSFLELFHGPTLAFKDIALSLLPHLMIASKKENREAREIVILTATSGDTGKAALEGFADVEGTRIVVFYPQQGVSEVQRRQMITQKGKNICVVGLEGNFDDAQSGVKALFGNREYEEALHQKGYKLSSANSINIGRLVPQIVYYFHMYGQMVKQGAIKIGEYLNVVVPTGNFGNILAAFYAKEMGLPLSKLICASNKNNVLYDFFTNGEYNRRREFYITNSPSMDILISSNLERLLYHISDEDTGSVQKFMDTLKEQGKYTITTQMKQKLETFYAGYADEEQTYRAIQKVYETSNYVMDPHTAVAYTVYEHYKTQSKDCTKTVIVATASPYKFPRSIMEAVGKIDETKTEYDYFKELEQMIGKPIPQVIQGIEHKEITHNEKCKVTDMKNVVDNFLN